MGTRGKWSGHGLEVGVVPLGIQLKHRSLCVNVQKVNGSSEYPIAFLGDSCLERRTFGAAGKFLCWVGVFLLWWVQRISFGRGRLSTSAYFGRVRSSLKRFFAL